MSDRKRNDGLFRALGKVPKTKIRMKGDAAPEPKKAKAHNFHPTPIEPIRSLLAYESPHLERYDTIWENAAGDGAMSREIERAGYNCISSDLIDRGIDAVLADFFEITEPLAPCVISNPPYDDINAGTSGGAWLQHTLALGVDYCAYLLNWQWILARDNGMGELLEAHPPSRVYGVRWRIDFSGEGSAPQNNGWYVWDKHSPPDPAPQLLLMDRRDPLQTECL